MSRPSEPLDCLAVVHRLWDFLDRELPPDEWEQVRHHLATCTGCRAHVDFCRSFLERVREAPVDPAEVAGLRRRVQAALQAEAARS